MAIDVVTYEKRGRKPDCGRCRGTGRTQPAIYVTEYGELPQTRRSNCADCRGTGIEDPYDGDTWMMDF